MHFGVEGLHIYSDWFWVASDSNMRNNMKTITFVSALTVDFADFLRKPIVIADGHADTALDFKY